MNQAGIAGAARIMLGQNLTWGLADALGRSIVDGAFPDGALPTEPELECRYSVSRSVVREAVKMLAAKGMVITRPRQGSVIEPHAAWNLFDPLVIRWLIEGSPPRSLVHQLCEFAMEVEPSAAALAARVGSREHHALIQTACDRVLHAQGSGHDRCRATTAFHRSLLAASGNVFHLQAGDLVEGARQLLVRYTTNGAAPANLSERYRSVTRAIQMRSAERARREMTALLEVAFEPLVRTSRAA